MNFTEEQLQILKKANITKDRFQDCYFTDDNKLFIKTKDKTAQEVYQEWIKNKDKPIIQEITEQEKLNAQLLQANAQQQLVNASLLKQIAELKGGN